MRRPVRRSGNFGTFDFKTIGGVRRDCFADEAFQTGTLPVAMGEEIVRSRQRLQTRLECGAGEFEVGRFAKGLPRNGSDGRQHIFDAVVQFGNENVFRSLGSMRTLMSRAFFEAPTIRP